MDTTAAGSDSLVHSTYFGGEADDAGFAIAVTKDGDLVITGVTTSLDSPLTEDTPQEANGGGTLDAFVARLSLDAGEQLSFSTCLGSDQVDWGADIAVDKDGRILVCGYTESTDLPTTEDAVSEVPYGVRDVFLVRYDAPKSPT